MLRPVVSKVSETENDVDFYYVDVDQSPEFAEKFGISSIPTLLQLKQGKLTNQSVGAISEAQVKQFAHS